MNVALENFIIDHRATFKSYVRRDMARLSIKLGDGTQMEASGRNYDAAMTKLMEKLQGGDKKDRKAARKEKRKLIEGFLSERDLDQEIEDAREE